MKSESGTNAVKGEKGEWKEEEGESYRYILDMDEKWTTR